MLEKRTTSTVGKMKIHNVIMHYECAVKWDDAFRCSLVHWYARKYFSYVSGKTQNRKEIQLCTVGWCYSMLSLNLFSYFLSSLSRLYY